MGRDSASLTEGEAVAGWSFRCGRKTVSAVRVYERRAGASLYIEWYDAGERVQRSLTSVVGAAVTDKRLAMRIAQEVSRSLEAASNQRARTVLFGSEHGRTIDELVDEYHRTPKARSWSDHHRKAMERFRDFWLGRFRGMPLTDITVAHVEREAMALDVSDETKRKYLVYLTGAYNFAVRKLKWIDARQDLAAVDLPSSDARGESYTLAEVRKLLPALESIDRRAGWVGHVAFQCGRRLSAIQAVRYEDVDVRDDHSVITFHRDKAGNVSAAVVTGRAHELTAAMEPSDFGPTDHECRVWIKAAEKAAGVESRPGRAWHALKRAFATVAAGEAAAAHQSGTRRETLQSIYEQDWLGPKVELARKIAEAME